MIVIKDGNCYRSVDYKYIITNNYDDWVVYKITNGWLKYIASYKFLDDAKDYVKKLDS